MADNDTLPRKSKPFLFDVNNFDDPNGDPDAPPPPPVFNEQEMEAARLAAHEQGRAAGIAESEASRERLVASLVQTMTSNFRQLFEAEKNRSDQFEGEVLLLTGTIFTKMFPALNEAHGLDEVKAAIGHILENHRQQPEIIVEIHSDFVDDITAIGGQLGQSIHNGGKVTVVANDSLAKGDCRLRWNDGGAERNATALSAQIRKTLDEALADRPRLQDNRAEE